MRAGALLAFLVLLVALGGCGGGGDEPGSATTSAPPEQATTSQGQGEGRGEEAGEGQGAKTPQQTPPQPNPPIAQERTPGSKAVAPGVPTTKGADNSIQAFGAESEEDQAAQATQTLGDYLDARARGDWPTACEAASAEYKRQLEELIERAKAKGGAEKPSGCPETLEALYGKAPTSTLKQTVRIGQVLSFRVREDGYAYLIYEAPEGEVKFIAMANDGGTWKVNTVEPSAFQASQGESQ